MVHTRELLPIRPSRDGTAVSHFDGHLRDAYAARALAVYKHQGIDTVAAPCESLFFVPSQRISSEGWQAAVLIPEVGSLHLTTLALREMLGTAVYRAAGRL